MKLEEQGYAIFDCSKLYVSSCEVSSLTSGVIAAKAVEIDPNYVKGATFDLLRDDSKPDHSQGATSVLPERSLSTLDLQAAGSCEGLP